MRLFPFKIDHVRYLKKGNFVTLFLLKIGHVRYLKSQDFHVDLKNVSIPFDKCPSRKII
jgi:hypothetical protein